MQKVTTQEMIVLLNEIREQAVAAVVERGDGEEHDPIMEMLARKVQIINAIAERVGKLTAEEFFETVTEECARHEGVCTADSHPCRGCAFDHKCPYATEDWRGAINLVKRWKEEQDEICAHNAP